MSSIYNKHKRSLGLFSKLFITFGNKSYFLKPELRQVRSKMLMPYSGKLLLLLLLLLIIYFCTFPL